MRILVTGASGFVGRHTVDALLRRGLRVRAMVRPSTDISPLAWRDHADVELARVDLFDDLAPLFDGVDAVIHLAARMRGTPQQQRRVTVEGTQRLLDAMADSSTRRLVHVSSVSVYDFDACGDRLDEHAPLFDPATSPRDGYAISKLRQERCVRDFADTNDVALTVVRPGLIWGPTRERVGGVGVSAGPLLLVVAPSATLRLTHVDNCADAIARCVADDAAAQTFNIVDRGNPSRLAFARLLRRHGRVGTPVPVPHAIAGLGVGAAYLLARCVGLTRRLPGVLVPARFAAAFRPVELLGDHLRDALKWEQPHTFDACVARTFGDTSEGAPDG